MKKIMTLAAMFAAVMVSFSSCTKDDKPQGGNETVTCPDCGEAEEDCTCNDFQAAIQIDGDFADWAAVTPVSATCNPDAKYTALTTLKVYTDEMYIHIYFEFSEDEIVDLAWVPFHVYINQDNNTEGCGDDQWIGQGGQDWLLEGAVIAETFCSYNPGMFAYDESVINADTGAPAGDGDLATIDWAWADVLPEGSGIASGAGNGNKYELSIMKEMMPGMELAETFGLGVDIQQSWNSVGVLPNDAITDTNASGAAPMLQVPAVM
jgi:hypothetical protein